MYMQEEVTWALIGAACIGYAHIARATRELKKKSQHLKGPRVLPLDSLDVGRWRHNGHQPVARKDGNRGLIKDLEVRSLCEALDF